jgi:uncharacterized protein (DUF305 family)
MRISKSLLFSLLAVLLPLAAPAQDMKGMAMPSATNGGSSDAFKAANDKMMKDMDVPLTGDTDKDFVASMIPHHTGAVDMAKIELRDGKDPALKKLARDIIAAQNKEIAFLKQWQAKHGG